MDLNRFDMCQISAVVIFIITLFLAGETFYELASELFFMIPVVLIDRVLFNVK